MPSAVAGNLVLDSWTVRDPVAAPLTGMAVPTHVTLALKRQSGSAMVAATESIAWTEIGSSGTYYFSFTPENTGLYLLILDEVGAATMQRKGVEFRWEVAAAGAVFAPSYANAFCSESDLERWLQQAISATSQPSDVQAGGFAESRAAVLMSLCAGLGYAVTPATVAAGSRLENLLREANAVGAAMDFTMAQSFMRAASKTERATILLDVWESYVGRWVAGKLLPGIIGMEITANAVSLATSHVLSGDTTARASENAPQDIGVMIRMDEDF
jgi:hypothetical protein